MAGAWTRDEVELIVEGHLAMLAAELRGEPVNKTAHRLGLMQRLPGRTRRSIEYKHQNIGAALVDGGFRHLTGYLPAFDYRSITANEVETSRELEPTWWLYRVFDFAGGAGVYARQGRVDASFLPQPTTWRASVP